MAPTENIGDRRTELQAFDDTKAGVKGLVDAGVKKLPKIFIHPALDVSTDAEAGPSFALPVIDLHGMEHDPVAHARVVDEVRRASETWGFFQVVNHGVPESITAEILAGIRRFHEQDAEVKKQFYTRDISKTFLFNSNFDLFCSPAANWRDSFGFRASPNPPSPEEFPLVCREILTEYPKRIMELGRHLLELIAEGLGLSKDHLLSLEAADSLLLLCHYYPPCPEPSRTLGTTRHSDGAFMTILLQDTLGGLQILHQGHWVDVSPIPGALLVNIGDLLQLVTNDKLKSAEHRVLASDRGARVSAASFFGRNSGPKRIVLAPIRELLCDGNPAKYIGTTADEYADHFRAKGLDGTSALLRFRTSKTEHRDPKI